MQQPGLMVVVVFSLLQPVAGTLASEAFNAGQVADEQGMLGRRVQAVQQALQNPGEPDALAAIVELGRDQRYYVMVRGWLDWQLRGDLDILSASDGQAGGLIKRRIELIQEAIRAIDLE